MVTLGTSNDRNLVFEQGTVSCEMQKQVIFGSLFELSWGSLFACLAGV